MIKYLLKHTFAAAIGCLLMAVQQAQAINLDFSNVTNAQIVFDGNADTFSFLDGDGGYDFKITSGGSGAATNLRGNISGTFNIGSVFTMGALQSAPVTGVGGFSISDGLSVLTADIAWIDIFTLGTIGGINAGGVLNLSNVHYTGLNIDLQALAAPGTADATVSFQFASGQTLTQLKEDGIRSTSYSGSTSASAVPDGGSTLALLGITFIGIEGLRRKFAIAG